MNDKNHISFKAFLVILFVLFVLIPTLSNFSISSVKNANDNINKEYNEHKNYVTGRIDSMRKFMDEMEDSTDQWRFQKRWYGDKKQSLDEQRTIKEEMSAAANSYIKLLDKNRERLMLVKNDLSKFIKNNNISEYCKYESYGEAIVGIVHEITFLFNSGATLNFSECDEYKYHQYPPRSNIITICVCDQESPLNDYRGERLDELTRELGEAYLMKNQKDRNNKIIALRNLASEIKFFDAEEDKEVRIGRVYIDYPVKALLPYKEFIFEILEAQKYIDEKEAQTFLKKIALKRCIKDEIGFWTEVRRKKGRETEKVTENTYVSSDTSGPIKDVCAESNAVNHLHAYHRLNHHEIGQILIKLLAEHMEY